MSSLTGVGAGKSCLQLSQWQIVIVVKSYAQRIGHLKEAELRRCGHVRYQRHLFGSLLHLFSHGRNRLFDKFNWVRARSCRYSQSVFCRSAKSVFWGYSILSPQTKADLSIWLTWVAIMDNFAFMLPIAYFKLIWIDGGLGQAMMSVTVLNN